MVTIDKKWECWGIAHNDQYIATIGNGVTVWNRATLDLVHHFAGMRWIHGGIFVNDDVLMVYTGEQKLFFFQISQRKLLWAVPRPSELDSSGDMCCCHIPGTEKIACIARGRKSLNDLFLLTVDWNAQELCLQCIPDCYRVVSNFVWTQQLGLTFLSRQAKGDDTTMVFRIHQVDNIGKSLILYSGESTHSILAYSGNYLFMADYSSTPPKSSVYPLEQSSVRDNLKLGSPLSLPILPLLEKGPVGTQRFIFPRICWINEKTGLLVACSNRKSVGIYDFLNVKMISEYPNGKVLYGKLLDGRLLIGCASGFAVELLNRE